MNLPLPPYDENAEQAALGCLMLSHTAFREMAEVITPEDFYKPAHAQIWAAAVGVVDDQQPVDAVTLADELDKRGVLAKVGGAPYLHTLVQVTPHARNAAYYAGIVAEKATQRRLIEAGTRIVQIASASDVDVDELVERARAELDKLAVSQRSADTLELAELIPMSLDDLEQPVKPGYPTGLQDLDEVLGGLHPGTLTVIGARPGIGKSILALRFAAHVAAAGLGAIMFSLEMSRQELMGRFFASEASVELTALHRHALSDDDWRRIAEVSERAREWPLSVADVPRIGVTGITSRARDRVRTARGLALVVVDYLQLMTPSDARAPRQEQIAGISRGLKLLARELGVAVVAAAQLNRGSEQRADRRPTLADLRESGAIEADADAVLLLHDEGKPGQLEVIVAKNRHGPKKSVQLGWAPYFATARSLARGEYEEAS